MNSLSSIDLLIIVIAIAALIIAAIFIPRYMVLNAMKKILKTMINNDAISPQNAQTAEQIGIKRGAMWDSMFRGRDYRPQALNTLVESEIVVNTMDGRYYISKNKLRISRFKDLYPEVD